MFFVIFQILFSCSAELGFAVLRKLSNRKAEKAAAVFLLLEAIINCLLLITAALYILIKRLEDIVNAI